MDCNGLFFHQRNSEIMRVVQNNNFGETRYGRLAKIYDFLDLLHFGHIGRRSSNFFLGQLPHVPQNPLIVGCGSGDFAVAYIQSENPNRLTINDLAPGMIELTKRRIGRLSWPGKLLVLQGDITQTAATEEYDFIALPYVLNMFSPRARIEFLKKIKSILKPEGVILVSDFARPRHPLFLLLHYLIWGLAVLFFWAAAGNKPNRLGEMPQHFHEAGLSMIQSKRFLGGLYAAVLLKK